MRACAAVPHRRRFRSFPQQPAPRGPPMEGRSLRHLGRTERPVLLISGVDPSGWFDLGGRIASPEMFPRREVLPHLICCRPGLAGGVGDEAAEHGDA
jgi:hypothetical protein